MANDTLLKLIDSAAKGNVFAAAQLGEGYMKGTFGQKNLEKALKWSKYAAKRGNDHAAELVAEIEKKMK